MATPTRVIGLDVKGTQAESVPLFTGVLQGGQLILAVDHITEKHDCAKILKPVGTKCRNAEGFEERVCITLLDFEIELRAEVA